MAFNVSYNFIANNSFSGVAKQIKKSTDRVRKAVKSTGKQLVITNGITNRVGKSMKSSFGKISKAGLKSSKILNKATQSTGKQLVKVKNIANTVTDSIDADFKKTASVSGSSFRKINRFINSSRKALEKFKRTRAFTSMRSQVRRLSKDFKRLGKTIRKSMSQSGKGFRNFIVGAGIITGLVKATRVGADFQDSIADLSAITGATGTSLSEYTEEILELSKASSTAQNSTALAFAQIASGKSEILGTKGALKELVKQSLLLANASGIDVPDAVRASVGALNQFSAGADQAERFVNVIAAGAQIGASLVGETADALKNVGKIAATFNTSFEETNALIQVLAKSETRGAEAGTKLKTVFLRLNKSLGDAGGKFAKMRPEIVGITKSLEFLNSLNLTVSQSTKVFGDEALNAGLILTQDIALVKKWTTALTGTKVAQQQASIRLSTFNSKMRRLGIIIKDKIIRLFQRLEPLLTSLAIKFGKWVDSITPEQINKFSKDLKIFIDDAVQLGKTISTAMKNAFTPESINAFKDSLGDVLEALGLISKAIVGTSKAFKSVGTGIGETAGAVETNTIPELITKKFAESLDFFGIIDIKKIKAESANKKINAVKPIVPNLTIVQSFPELFPLITGGLPSISTPILPTPILPTPALGPTPILPTPSLGPTVDPIGDSKSIIDININAPRDTVKSVLTRDVGVGKKLNVGVNMKEAI